METLKAIKIVVGFDPDREPTSIVVFAKKDIVLFHYYNTKGISENETALKWWDILHDGSFRLEFGSMYSACFLY